MPYSSLVPFKTVTALWLCGLSLAASATITPQPVRRLDDNRLELRWTSDKPVDVYLASAANAPLSAAKRLASQQKSGVLVVAAPARQRPYFLLQEQGDAAVTEVAERQLALQQGSNFRDLGGYATEDGRHVKWGKLFRSGAMPLLTEADYQLLEGLKLGSIINLRSTDERQIAPDQLDDRTGALFISNDYSLKILMQTMQQKGGEDLYAGMEQNLKPQFRALFKRLLADEGATLYHCSAGQDRTGVATALIYSALGVPRDSILQDYHLSTQLRRPQFEMPPLNPADWPGNPILPYYIAAQKTPGGAKAEPLFTASGQSHLAQFFRYIDQRYGSVGHYLNRELGLGANDINTLKAIYLQ